MGVNNSVFTQDGREKVITLSDEAVASGAGTAAHYASESIQVNQRTEVLYLLSVTGTLASGSELDLALYEEVSGGTDTLITTITKTLAGVASDNLIGKISFSDAEENQIDSADKVVFTLKVDDTNTITIDRAWVILKKKISQGITLDSLVYKGDIAANSDFPTLAEVTTGWLYEITVDVTDDDATKTNTGQSFVVGDEIYWVGSSWSILGGGGRTAIQTLLTITATISSGTSIDTTASGTGYTKKYDTADFNGSAANFQADPDTYVEVNGVDYKELMSYVNDTTFSLPFDLYNGDVVYVNSY